jgi:PAS domain-containing protein
VRRLPDLAGLPTAIAVAALAAVAIVGLRPVVAAAFACVCALAAMIDQRVQRLRRAGAAASAATPTTRVGDDWASTVAQSFGIRVYGGIQSGLVFAHTRSNGDFTGLLGGQPPCDVDIEEFWMSRIHPDDLAGYLAELGLERMEPGVPLELEYRVIGLDGLTRHVFERLFPRERYANGDVRVEGLVLDVSDQVRAREAIAATGRRAHEIAQSVGAYIYEGRLHPDGRWETTFNAVPDGDRLGLARTLEGFEDSWRGRVLRSDLDDHDRTFNYEAARAGRPLHCEYRMRDRDGGSRRSPTA